MLAYYGEYWNGVLLAFITGGVGVGFGFCVSYLTGRSEALLMFLGACIALLVAVTFPHGYTLFESSVLHHHSDVSFFAESFSNEQLWAFIGARFWGALAGSIGAAIGVAYLSPRWR